MPSQCHHKRVSCFRSVAASLVFGWVVVLVLATGHGWAADARLDLTAMASRSLFKFIQEVRAETEKVTWPTRKEVWITTVAVLVMVTLAALFFIYLNFTYHSPSLTSRTVALTVTLFLLMLQCLVLLLRLPPGDADALGRGPGCRAGPREHVHQQPPLPRQPQPGDEAEPRVGLERRAEHRVDLLQHLRPGEGAPAVDEGEDGLDAGGAAGHQRHGPRRRDRGEVVARHH